MKKLSSFFLSSVLHKKVYNELNEFVGKLWDVYVSTDLGMPRAIAYQIKNGSEISNCEFKNINFYENEGRIIIRGEGIRDIMLQKYSYLLSKHLLDRQIVDINGKKLVRVNDLRITEMAGEYRVVAVDTGVMALGRRLGIEKLMKRFCERLNKRLENSLIVWDSVESLEMVSKNLKLSVPYKKLSKLHPADLADIVEDMDVNYRKKVFESLDRDLAADTLEEIQPDMQLDILENLSQDKKSEVLQNMPNDEIADMLDEVDSETAWNILMNMKKEDAEEVRSLMDYKDETVGSIMNTDFISFNINITVGEIIDIIRQTNPDDEVSHYIYVTDSNGKIEGVVSLKDLILSDSDCRLKDIMFLEVERVDHNENIENAIEICTKYNLLSVPVVDDSEKLCGIVIMNDIVEKILMPSWRKKLKKVV